MLQGRGRTFPTETIEKIRQLLAVTDVSLAEISERMNCSKSAVTSINSKYQVRVYENKRTRWTVKAADFPQKSLRNDESAERAARQEIKTAGRHQMSDRYDPSALFRIR